MKTLNIFFTFLMIAVSLNTFAHVSISSDMISYQNNRPYQEDRFMHTTLDGEHFFGIYDGHGGADVSSYLKETLHKHFANFISPAEDIRLLPLDSVQRTFENAFAQAEKEALALYEDGSTALAIFIDHINILHLAWVGDSRAVIEKNGLVDLTTFDQKPNREDEKKRIEQAGGTIYHHGVWRVNGLAVSRSIGDQKVKKDVPNQIIAIPEYLRYELTEDNNFMILASDGLWDVMTDQEAITLVHMYLQNNGDSTPAESLQKEAVTRGSQDNITICIVYFDWHGNQSEHNTTSIATHSIQSVVTHFWNKLWSRKKSN